MFFKKRNLPPKAESKVEKKMFSTFGFNDVLHYIKREVGVDLFGKKSIIETKIKHFCEEREIDSFKQLHENIQYQEPLQQELINLLTVNETYFYREEKQLQEAIAFAKNKGGNIKILCAPCASGEEVYTLSMMMNEELGKSANFTITGIDINSEAINRANEGLFSERSLHKLESDLKRNYFSLEKEKYRVKKHCFPSVSFRKINIFDSSFLNLGSFDIIFSRNMLIYFDDDFRVKTMQRFCQLLKSDGRVYLGHADIVPKNQWLEKNGFGSSCYYTKS